MTVEDIAAIVDQRIIQAPFVTIGTFPDSGYGEISCFLISFGRNGVRKSCFLPIVSEKHTGNSVLNTHTFWLEGHVGPEVQDALRVSGYSVCHTHGWNGDKEPQTKVTYQTVSAVATVDVIEG